MKKISLSLFFISAINFCFAQSVSLKDFEKMPSVKSPKEYLGKKDFTVKQDSSSGENIKLKLVNRATREIIYVTSIKDSEGARSFEADYFTESKEEYAKIVHTILKSGYNPIRDNRHYDKRIGSYETHKLDLREMVAIKDKDYYNVKYSYYAGKELSLPAQPVSK